MQTTHARAPLQGVDHTVALPVGTHLRPGHAAASSCSASCAESRSGDVPPAKHTLERSMGDCLGSTRCARAAMRVESTPPLNSTSTGAGAGAWCIKWGEGGRATWGGGGGGKKGMRARGVRQASHGTQQGRAARAAGARRHREAPTAREAKASAAREAGSERLLLSVLLLPPPAMPGVQHPVVQPGRRRWVWDAPTATAAAAATLRRADGAPLDLTPHQRLPPVHHPSSAPCACGCGTAPTRTHTPRRRRR